MLAVHVIFLCHIFDNWDLTIRHYIFSLAYMGRKTKVQAFTFQKKGILIQFLGQISQGYIWEMQKNVSS